MKQRDIIQPKKRQYEIMNRNFPMEVPELYIANYVVQIEATNLDKLQPALTSWAKLSTLHEFYPISLLKIQLCKL